MYVIQSNSLNEVMIEANRHLIRNGVCRYVGGRKCSELPEPICLKITNPSDRLITMRERKWNVFLAYAESLWIVSGRNDLSLIGHYLNRLKDFSDDGLTLRGGYGPRLRAYNNNQADYFANKIQESQKQTSSEINVGVDQLKFVVACFKEDPNTRQAVIQFGDPIKDCFTESDNKKFTKDFPCTRTLHFMKDPTRNSLNLIVHMRSNDVLWGTTGVNIFNFTFMQEYLARIIGLDLGIYYHIADNLHYYYEYHDKIKLISELQAPPPCDFRYSSRKYSLSEFDQNIARLSDWEENFRNTSAAELIEFGDPFFDDWAKVLYSFSRPPIFNFENPVLNELIKSSTRVLKEIQSN